MSFQEKQKPFTLFNPCYVSEIDQHRMAFFERMIEEERAKERTLQHIQKTCYHRYEIVSLSSPILLQLECTKCGYTTMRTLKPKTSCV